MKVVFNFKCTVTDLLSVIGSGKRERERVVCVREREKKRERERERERQRQRQSQRERHLTKQLISFFLPDLLYKHNIMHPLSNYMQTVIGI